MIDDPEQLRSIIRMATEMRLKQKEYFKTRDRGVLVESKQREAEFDKIAAWALAP